MLVFLSVFGIKCKAYGTTYAQLLELKTRTFQEFLYLLLLWQ